MTPFTVPDDGLVIPAAIAELPTPAKEIRLHKGLVVQDRTLRFTKIGKIIDYDKMYIRVQYEGEDTTTRIYRRLWKRRLTVIPKTTIATKAAIPTLPAIKPIVGMPVIITAAFDDYDDAIGKTATIEKIVGDTVLLRFTAEARHLTWNYPLNKWRKYMDPVIPNKPIVGLQVKGIKEYQGLPEGGIGTIVTVSWHVFSVEYTGDFARAHDALHGSTNEVYHHCWDYPIESWKEYVQIVDYAEPKPIPVPKVGMKVQMLKDNGIRCAGEIGQITVVSDDIYSIRFFGTFARDNPDYLHADKRGNYDGECYDFTTRRWEEYVKVLPADYKLPDPAPAPVPEVLEQKYLDMGITTTLYKTKMYYILPFVFQPQLLRRRRNNELYEIPQFLQDKLRTKCKCVIQKDTAGSKVLSLATEDMKHGFVHFHSWGSGPFDAFCSGSLDVKRIENVDDAIDLRDRCQSMLEIIGYDEDPPVSKVNDVNITEIREWSIIPATHRGFDSGASMGGSIAIANAETRKKAVELARAKMDEAQKKFQYLKDIMETADKEEKEKETVDA